MNPYGTTICIIFHLFSYLPVFIKTHQCWFPVGPREIKLWFLVFMLFVIVGSSLVSTHDLNTILQCLSKPIRCPVTIYFGEYFSEIPFPGSIDFNHIIKNYIEFIGDMRWYIGVG